LHHSISTLIVRGLDYFPWRCFGRARLAFFLLWFWNQPDQHRMSLFNRGWRASRASSCMLLCECKRGGERALRIRLVGSIGPQNFASNRILYTIFFRRLGRGVGYGG
ncbi:hypothetical protein KC19_11G079900, partial [Ceratodon purpureus]